ncbi:protein amalgam-like isoform X2 [Eriocheir sinensis]|uniref:protein amalgam-like isoform X2 n=1 Tax=Eriocheir sinensis TaxID=95602 RepID=UPI0021C66092|nr:protein amalgam-like isoform X2 [Eriocheir sinensis]
MGNRLLSTRDLVVAAAAAAAAGVGGIWKRAKTENGSKVEWRRALNLTFPGGAAVVGGRSVFFDFVGREDAGTYICTARNNGSSTYSTALTIHVQYAPVVGVWARTVGQEGMELGCLGEGRPQPTLAWYKNNTKLSNACGGHTEVKSTALSPGFVLSVAKLTNTSEQDFALYHCRAANSLRVSRSFLMVHDGSGEMSVDYLDHEDPVVYSTPVENPRLASFLLGMVPPLYIALYIIAYLSCYKSPSTGGHGRFGANMDMDGE